MGAGDSLCRLLQKAASSGPKCWCEVRLLAFGIVDGLLRSTRSGHNQGAGSKQLGGSDGMHLGVRRGNSWTLFGELCSKPKTGIRVDECRTRAHARSRRLSMARCEAVLRGAIQMGQAPDSKAHCCPENSVPTCP